MLGKYNIDSADTDVMPSSTIDCSCRSEEPQFSQDSQQYLHCDWRAAVIQVRLSAFYGPGVKLEHQMKIEIQLRTQLKSEEQK